MDFYGFDRLLYGFSRFTTGTSVGDPKDFLILSNHKKDYLEGFVDTEHLMNSPMVKWSIQNDGACSWRLIHSLMPKINWTNKLVRLWNLIVNIMSMRVTRLVLWAFQRDRAAQYR